MRGGEIAPISSCYKAGLIAKFCVETSQGLSFRSQKDKFQRIDRNLLTLLAMTSNNELSRCAMLSMRASELVNYEYEQSEEAENIIFHQCYIHICQI